MAGQDIGRPWSCSYITCAACSRFWSVTPSARKPGEPRTQRSELHSGVGASLSVTRDRGLVAAGAWHAQLDDLGAVPGHDVEPRAHAGVRRDDAVVLPSYGHTGPCTGEAARGEAPEACVSRTAQVAHGRRVGVDAPPLLSYGLHCARAKGSGRHVSSRVRGRHRARGARPHLVPNRHSAQVAARHAPSLA